MRGVFAVISVGLVVACHPAGRHGERPAPPAAELPAVTVPPPAVQTAMVTGMVLDEALRDPLVGATVVLESDTHGEEVELSDEDGHFAITLAPGAWQVSTYWAGVQTSHGAIEVIAGETTDLELLIPHEATLDRGGETIASAACPPSAHPPVPGDRDAVLRAALGRYLAGVGASSNVWPAGEPIYVLTSPQMPIGAPALPPTTRRLVVRTDAELGAEATRRDHTVGYIDVSIHELGGACARVSIGRSLAQPKRDRADYCTCSDHERWVKQDGQWRFDARGLTTCGM